MTRSCYHPTRGYCFCEFCIAAHLKNAYVQANNSPNEPINFKNFKKSIQLSPFEIYCKQFSKVVSNDELSTNSQRAYTPLNSPNNQQANKINSTDDNQTKFLRILSDRLTQLADQQAAYIINSKTSAAANLLNPNNSTLLQRRSKRLLNNIKLNLRTTRIRSSMSESSGYETGEPIESPLPNTSVNTTHCSSAGMLFNSTSLSINDECKNRTKFGPEDILFTTNPMLLFSSNLVDESTVSLSKKSSRRRRKSNKKESTNNECPDVAKSSTNVTSTPLSNVTNTISQ